MTQRNYICNSRYSSWMIGLISILYITPAGAQTFSVNGTVSVPTTTVRNASVTFIDLSDTTKKFSAITDASGNYMVDVVTSISSDEVKLPGKFELEQNYPNPFSSKTSIPYKLNQTSKVQITIYDLLGRVVKKFTATEQSAGSHKIVWDGMNNSGKQLAPGIYFYELQARGEKQIKKMLLGLVAAKGTGSGPSGSHVIQNKRSVTPAVMGGTYQVRIENTGSTFPVIISQSFDNQEVTGNMTLNFTVASEYPIANSDIDLNDTRQIIRGFGAANILPWRPDMTADEIAKAFGTEDGQIGFSILRLRVPSDPDEFSLNVTTAKAAYDMGVTIMASPWSPPAAMKTNNDIVRGRLKEESYAEFAAYLKSFADYMSENGVPIHSISVQNEPDVQVDYESCDYNADEMLKFMKENAPAVGVKVCAPESYHFDKAMSDPILNDSLAAANTAYISGHIYGGGLEPYPLAVEKDKELWMTEHLELSTDWAGALGTAKEINDCMNAGMSAYIWWYIVRFYGPILDGEATDPPGAQKGDVSKRGFVISQFARFIRPGYYRVQCNTLPQRNVYLSSYKESESKVTVVAINTGSSPVYQTFAISGGNISTVLPYTTSEEENCAGGEVITVMDGTFTALLAPSSVTTFVSN